MALSLATGSAQSSNCSTQTPLYPATGSYAFAKDDPGEAIMSNTAGALDQPNTVRYAVSNVADVFKNASLSPSAGQRVDGLSILVQVNEVWKIDDAADSLAPIYFPASAHMVLKVPNDALVTSSVLSSLVLRLVGAPFRNGTDTLAVAYNPLLHSICRF